MDNIPAETNKPRCKRCGWPLAATMEEGCVEGDCSFRPKEYTDEWYRMKAIDDALQSEQDGDAEIEAVARIIAVAWEFADESLRNKYRKKARRIAARLRSLPERESLSEIEAHRQLSQLLIHYAPNCEPLPDLLGLVSQIDNLMVGLADRSLPVKSEPEAEDRVWLTKAATLLRKHTEHECIEVAMHLDRIGSRVNVSKVVRGLGDSVLRDSAVAWNRLLSLSAEAFGTEGMDDGPEWFSELFEYGSDVALGLVKWPSSQAAVREARIRESLSRVQPIANHDEAHAENIALRNCLRLALNKTRNPDSKGDWPDIIRFCEQAGITLSPLRVQPIANKIDAEALALNEYDEELRENIAALHSQTASLSEYQIGYKHALRDVLNLITKGGSNG